MRAAWKSRLKQELMLILLITATTATTFAQNVKLSNGDEVEVFYLGYGPYHEFDLRSAAEKIRDKIPWKFRKHLPGGRFNTWAAMGSPSGVHNSIGIGLKYTNPTPGAPDLADEMVWILADNRGWYYSGINAAIRLESAVGTAYSLFPRTSPEITLSIFSTTPGRNTPEKLLGKVDLRNPGFDPSLVGKSTTPVPITATAGTCDINIEHIWTGIAVRDVPQFLHTGFNNALSCDVTSGIKELLAGHPAPAKFPEHTRSALVFQIKVESVPILERVRNAILLYRDSAGNSHKAGLSRLYKADEGLVLLWDKNLPLKDGNYEFELTVYEDPLLDSNSWKQTPAITPGAADPAGTKRLDLGTNTIHAGMTNGNNRIDLTATEDPSLLAIQAFHTETSAPLTLSPLKGGQWRDPYLSYAELAEPVTTGTVTLMFAKPIEHKVRFTGVPTRPTRPGP